MTGIFPARWNVDQRAGSVKEGIACKVQPLPQCYATRHFCRGPAGKATVLIHQALLSGHEALGAVNDSMEQEGDYARAAGAERKNCFCTKKVICEPELPCFACLLPIF
ncbi:hypothetical protein FDR11_09610 [Salmonella enterica]|nr:hypothetical protein [Salmonella enterica]EDN1393604.1 hypothetical protein [Salmonella enterica]